MNVRLLIEALVRQVTVLIAELATSGGLRAPLASIAEQVFQDLAKQLDELGVSRGVSADMFGMALRTYLRRIRRHDESVTRKGVSLWEGVLQFIEARGLVTREVVLEQFARDDEGLVRSVLQDLTDSGLVFRSGVRGAALYRIAGPAERAHARDGDAGAVDMLVWAVVRREGPLSRDALAERAALPDDHLDTALARLTAAGRIREIAEGFGNVYQADSIVIPVGVRAGWEAGVYDHIHAVVKTIICKLHQDETASAQRDRVGGSTYGFDVWAGHPFADRVYDQLRRFREATTQLRREVDEFNEHAVQPAHVDRVTVYLGQCVISEERNE
jgi:hypothetical protein